MTAESGLTLIETIIALLLVGLGILSIAPMFFYAMQDNVTSSNLGIVGALAVERLERLRELDTASPDLQVGGSLEANVSGAVSYFDDSDPGFVVRWEIRDYAPVPRTRTVAVRAVARRPVRGEADEVTLWTLRGE